MENVPFAMASARHIHISSFIRSHDSLSLFSNTFDTFWADASSITPSFLFLLPCILHALGYRVYIYSGSASPMHNPTEHQLHFIFESVDWDYSSNTLRYCFFPANNCSFPSRSIFLFLLFWGNEKKNKQIKINAHFDLFDIVCVYSVCVQYPKVPQCSRLNRTIFVYLLQKYHIKCLNCTKQRVIQSNIMTVFIRIILTAKRQIIAYCQIQPHFFLVFIQYYFRVYNGAVSVMVSATWESRLISPATAVFFIWKKVILQNNGIQCIAS